MIEELDIDDVKDTEECARAFFKESKMPGKLLFSHWMRKIEEIIHIGIGIVFVVRVQGEVKGMLGGVFSECMMTGEMEAIELFWYVMPETRGTVAGISLLRSFEKEAIKRGCHRIKMIHLADLNATIMQDIYARMGYTPCEFAYWKSLTPKESLVNQNSN